MILTKFYSGFTKSEGCVSLVKTKSKGKVTPQRWGRETLLLSDLGGSHCDRSVCFLAGRHTGVSLSQLTELFPHPNKEAMCGRAGRVKTTSLKKRK